MEEYWIAVFVYWYVSKFGEKNGITAESILPRVIHFSVSNATHRFDSCQET